MTAFARLSRALSAAQRFARSLAHFISPETAPSAASDTRASARGQRYLAATHASHEAHALLEAGDTAAAQAAAERGLAHDPRHPALREVSAWCALLTGRPADAVQTLEHEPAPSARRRLLLNLARAQSGRLAEAHLDLCEWSRCERCPAEALLLRAILDLQHSDSAAARAALQTSLDRSPDTLAWQMMTLLDLEPLTPSPQPLSSAAMLAHAFGHEAVVARWLASLDITAEQTAAQVPLPIIDQLAAQLLQHPFVIPTLVVAQRHEPRPHRIELLRRAIGRIVWELPDPVPAVEALAELSILSAQHDDARRWVHHGLRHRPYSASLALLLDRIDRDTSPAATDAAQTLDVLRRAATAHSGYADLRRAVILNCNRQGLCDLASRKAQQWIDREPNHPLARQTLRELAA
jgi:hypothetical protein